MRLGSISKRFVAILLSLFIVMTIVISNTSETAGEVSASSSDPVVVVLDPGHDYVHGGAYNRVTGCNETDANYAIARACRDYLSQYANVTVYMTTNGECLGESVNRNDTCLINRLAYADSVDCDLYVSFHCNSTIAQPGNSPSGSEVYISVNTPFNSNEKQLAEDILTGLQNIGFPNRGVVTRRSNSNFNSDYLGVLRRAVNYGFPSVLIEHGYVNNSHDAALLNDSATLTRIGQSDAEAIAKYFNLVKKNQAPAGNANIEVTPHVSGLGWIATMPEGLIAGAKDYANNIQAVKINVNNNGVSGSVNYSTFILGRGWTKTQSNGSVAGTVGESLPIEAIKISLSGDLANKYDIYYRVYSINENKWLGWAKNGAPAGTTYYGYELGGLQVKLVSKGGAAPGSTSGSYYENSNISADSNVLYQTHVQNYGWQTITADGNTSGTNGQSKRLEAIKIYNNTGVSGSIIYQTHVQTYGWQNWVSDGKLSGTSGQSKRLEAIRINLTGEMAEKYDIYYRVHAQTYGWLGWAKNGETAGTEGESKRLEAIQIVLVAKGSAAPGITGGMPDGNTSGNGNTVKVQYATHVQGIGWQGVVSDGASSGTVGSSKRLEAITITNTSGISGDISYRVHVQRDGWHGWVSNGQAAGTTGQSKRLEAIEINLSGELANQYDVYYRVHCQTYGWLDWAKNGQTAGTSGLSKRLEAIQIVLVPKGGAAPGSTARPYISN